MPYAKETKAQNANILYVSIIGRHPGKGKTIGTKIRLVLVTGWGGLTTKRLKENFRKCFILWLWWWVHDYLCLSKFIKLYTKNMMNSTVSKLYLSKSDFKNKKNEGKFSPWRNLLQCKVIHSFKFNVFLLWRYPGQPVSAVFHHINCFAWKASEGKYSSSISDVTFSDQARTCPWHCPLKRKEKERQYVLAVIHKKKLLFPAIIREQGERGGE